MIKTNLINLVLSYSGAEDEQNISELYMMYPPNLLAYVYSYYISCFYK